MTAVRSLLLGAALINLTSCGGISKKAKIATAIEVMMADTITSYASKADTTSLSVSFNCNGSDASGGTLSYTIPGDAASLADPQKLVDFIKANATGITFDVTYDQCEIKACGDKLILNGPATLKLNINVADYLAGDTSKTPASFTLSATELQATGLIQDSISFGYTIDAKYTSSSLESILIESASPANPLKTGGETYNAADILSLADGC